MAGLVDSFLQASLSLADMDRQRRRDEAQAAQSAVDDELRREQLRQQKEAQKQQDELNRQKFELDKQAEARMAGNAQSLDADRKARLAVYQQRAGTYARSLTDRDLRFIEGQANNLFKTLVTQGVDAETARQYADGYRNEEITQRGMTMPEAQPAETPTTLFPPGTQIQLPALGALPKAKAQVENLEASAALANERQQGAAIARQINEEKLAEMATNAALEQEYKRNRNRLQEERLKQMPLEATAQRLKIDLDKLRAQKLVGDIQMQSIDRSIKLLNRQKAEKSSFWTEDAKQMRMWLDKEYKSADVTMRNALGHLRQLNELQRRDDAAIRELETVGKSQPLSADQVAALAARRQRRDERQGSINFYSVEYGDNRKNRDAYQKRLNTLIGIDYTPVNSHGQVDKSRMGGPKPDTTLPPLRGLDQSRQILGSQRNAPGIGARLGNPKPAQAVRPPKGAKIISLDDFLAGKK